MAQSTSNYNLKKPSQEDFYNIEDFNQNADIIDAELKNLNESKAAVGHDHGAIYETPAGAQSKADAAKTSANQYTDQKIAGVNSDFSSHLSDNEYQTAAVTGTQIRITRQSNTKRLFFHLLADITGGVITISLDAGTTSHPLKDVDGNLLATLSKGYWEVVDNTSFFTLRPRGGGSGDGKTFFGKYVGTPLTLADSIKTGDYIYSNEDVQLELADIQPVVVDHSTPVTVVNSVYANSATARPQVLSNGWIIIVVTDTMNNKFYLLISKDNGATWSTLLYRAGVSTIQLSICSNNNTIYLLYNSTGAPSAVPFWKIDVPTFPLNTDLGTIPFVSLDSGQIAMGMGCDIKVDSTGALHAVWCSKNSTYPNSFNIRYSKSPDGGATWATPTQLSTLNTSGYNSINPVIVLKQDNNPVIIYQYADTAWRGIGVYRYNGTSWSASGSYIYQENNTSYSQAEPSGISTSTGIIRVVWSGVNATTSSRSNIFHSDSQDGGITWSAPIKLIQDTVRNHLSPCITRDDNNNLFVYWYGSDAIISSKYNIFKNVFKSSVWEGATRVTNNTVTGMVNPSLCENFKNFVEPLCVLQNQSGSIEFIGVWDIISNIQSIPSINNATAENQLQASGNGALKTSGSGLKRYSGFVSKKSKGWS